jgi:hypothetical protein
MEPLDSDYEYVARRESNPRARFNWLFLIPVLAFVWLLFLVASAVFQLPISGAVDPIMSLMILMFFVLVGLLFFALAPRSNR